MIRNITLLVGYVLATATTATAIVAGSLWIVDLL
jgi:hypothetical protein